jgi:hypothetical protein
MALAIAFIVRNARNTRSAAHEAKALSGVKPREMERIDKLLEKLDQEPFRTATGNTFGKPPESILDMDNPNITENIRQFRAEGDSISNDIQELHLNVSALQNATSGHTDRLLARYPNPAVEENVKLAAISNQIVNLSGAKFKGRTAPAGGDNVDRFWYVSEGGHGWAVVSRGGAQKYKLYDPNWGIIWFHSGSHLYEAVAAYQQGHPEYLEFSQ